MNSSSGIGDPYFFEWTIGLDKITSMLIPDEEIKSVTLQASIDTLDDVVCEYNDKIEFIQVKHTRINEKIGFSFLLSPGKKSDSLLMKIAKSWGDLKNKSKKECFAILLTNREPVIGATRISRGPVKIEAPSFNEFLTWFQQTSGSIQSLDSLRKNLPKKEWTNILESWLEEINVFEDENSKIEFIQKFKIKIEQPNTPELDKKLLDKIGNIFSVSQETSLELYQSLFYSLKKWASSTREQEKITVEDVYSSLAIKEEGYPQHLLLPPSPFFESRKNLISYIEERSKSKSQKMLFLYGKPGIGKTSLVNFLANKPNTIVDLRYHAYIPVTPDSTYVNLDFDKSITEEMMWGSLLNQLRELFRGKMYKYKVPIMNQFLSKEELRKTVLRLASVYGKIHNRNTVIVIDGIDHAARSGSKETFLRSLISPELVPDNIYFIICGQPAEDYEDYPIWLNPTSENVSLDKVELTGVILEDVKMLLKEINPDINDFNSAAKIIYEVSKGNTLSATFAAYESKNIEDSTELFSFLNEKNLNSNITEYYDSIWNSLDNKALKNSYRIKDLLATLFSITIEKVSIDDILEIFKNNNISKIEWQQILNFYSPLIIENEGKYTLYHNDIRVYLKNKLRKNSNIIVYVAGEIATYYLNFSRKSEVKHRDIFRLLDLANRSCEKVDIFSLDYINEAIMLGQEIGSVLKQFKEVVQQSEIDYNFEKIQNLALTSIYLNQYIKIMDYYEDVKPPIEIPNLIHSEYERVNLNLVKIKDIKIVVNDINTLVSDNQFHRAKALFERWFGDFESIITHLNNNELWHQDQGMPLGTTDTLTQIGYFSKVLNSNIDTNSIGTSPLIKSLIIYGQLEGLSDNATTLQFIRFFNKNISKLSTYQLEGLLDKLFHNEGWIKLSYVLSKIKKNKDWSYSSLDVKILFFNTIMARKQGTDPFYNEIKLKGFKALGKQDYDYYNKLNMFSAYSFILGYLGDFGSKELQINDGIREYYLDYGDDRGQPYLKRIIRISFELGNIFETKKRIDFSKFKTYLDYLFDKCMTPFLNGIYEVANQLCKFIFYLIEYSNDSVLESNLTSYLLNRIKSYGYRTNYSVTLTWEYLALRGYYSDLENWFDYWLGVKGEAWDLPLQDSISIYNLFSELMLKYEISNEAVEKSKERLYRNLLGFIEHKDMVLNYPYEILKRIVEVNLPDWSTKGLDLYNLSLLASKKGDNLLASSIEDLFFESAILSGPQEFRRLLDNVFFEKKIITKINDLIYFFEENWKNLNIGEDDLLGLWCLIEATSSKMSNNDNAKKIEFSNQVIEKLSGDKAKFLQNRTKVIKNVYFEKMHTKDNSQKELLKYYELPIDKLVNEFFNDVEKLEYQSYAWERFEIVASRIGKHRTKEFIRYKDALFSFFINRENHYSWESDHANIAAESLIPLLSSHQLEQMYSDIISNAFALKEPSYWLNSFTDDVNNYVLYMIKAHYPNKLIPFFDQQISLFSSWYNNNFKKVSLSSLKEGTTCWLDIFEQLLWLLFSTKNIERTMDSLNGIYYFMKNFIHRFDFEKLTSLGSVKQKYFILLLLEKLVREKQDITVAEPFLNYCLNDSQLLNLRLQSSLVLAYKNRDMNQLENSLNRKSVKKILTNPKSAIIEIPFLIKRIENLLGVGLGSAYIESYLSLEREYSKIKEIDLKEYRILKFMGSDKEDFIVQRFLNNKFEHLTDSISTLCQLCLPNDEPDIILFNPIYHKELDNFCNDMVDLDEQLVIQNGSKTLNINIPKDEILMAGSISFYPPNQSKIMALSKKIVIPYCDSNEEIGKTLGGRQFLKDLAVTPLDANKNGTLFNITYGYCYFVNEYYKMAPSNLFITIQERLGKKYDIRFELSYGIGEESYADMATFRQPTMQRWFMKKRDVEELQKELGILLEEANEIEDL